MKYVTMHTNFQALLSEIKVHINLHTISAIILIRAHANIGTDTKSNLNY